MPKSPPCRPRAAKRGSTVVYSTPAKPGVFGAAVYARVSTAGQSCAYQLGPLREYCARRGWAVVAEVQDVASGASTRPARDELIAAARRREIQAIVCFKLDRWGRSTPDLVSTLQELDACGCAFVSVTDALDLTTPSGRALAGMLAVFAGFERDLIRERVSAGIAEARRKGTRLGRPATAALKASQVRSLSAQGLSQRAIAAKLGIGAGSVARALAT